jgi:hypothetical protein
MKWLFKNYSHCVVAVLFSLLLFSSCKKFLDAELDKSLLESDKVYSNDVTATASVISLYVDLANPGLIAGSPGGVQSVSSLSAAELTNYPRNPGYVEFDSHNLLPTNNSIKAMWDALYSYIYRTNTIVQGLEVSNGVTSATKSQLKGEALFVRAFCYFYLVNLYGGVPIVTGTDYTINSSLSRSSVDDVYAKIIDDLKQSQSLLIPQYPTAQKVRPNKHTATALLARVYLYRGDWLKAEAEASSVIAQTQYSLPALNVAFLANNTDAIWQIMSVVTQINTWEAYYNIFSSTPQNHVLTTSFLNSFEPNDGRKTSWIGSATIPAGTFYYPAKYKALFKPVSDPWTEYTTPFRLAEQYLIRAEAFTKQNKLAQAIADLDKIRSRAGLPLIANTNPSISQADLLLAIERERSSELFVEYGHRWFDLKRTNRAQAVIGGAITQNDLLWPIPQSEFDRNPNLGQQNPGY